MNRRASIKQLLAASGSLAVLPSWALEWRLPDVISYRSSLFDDELQVILSSVVDTIIPAGNNIGALAVGVDKFLVKLIDKCYEPAVGTNVKTQLGALNTASTTAHGKLFNACDQAQRESLLLKFSNSNDKDEKDFFNLIKSEAIRGFNTSKEVMTQYLGYKIAPGHYYGCVDVKAS